MSLGHVRSITEALPGLAGKAREWASDRCGNVIQEFEELSRRTAAQYFSAIFAPEATEQKVLDSMFAE